MAGEERLGDTPAGHINSGFSYPISCRALAPVCVVQTGASAASRLNFRVQQISRNALASGSNRGLAAC